jgi:tripartite-type tricarboxylate transporter receptor subunit TctC
LAPEIPTVSESGYPGFQNSSWWGVLAPSGTSVAIVKSLNLEITSILNDPEFRKTLAHHGAEPFPQTPDQFSEFLRSEIERAAKLIQSAGISKEP